MSPEADASLLPSGLKETYKIASEWPSSVLEALVTGLILNIASGLYVRGKIISELKISFYFYNASYIVVLSSLSPRKKV